MSSSKRLWIAAFVVIAASFAALGLFGAEIYRQAPPVPERVVTTDGRTLFTRDQILDGQNVWQSMGGQNLGSIWGHGGYVAPDWSADWLHREIVTMLDARARREHGMDTLRWLRVVGDTIFAVGALLLAWFVLGLKTGWSVRAEVESRDVRTTRPYGTSGEGEPGRA